jgi:subtilisin-like proprotein convertase family protein/subtilisin family serine protease
MAKRERKTRKGAAPDPAPATPPAEPPLYTYQHGRKLRLEKASDEFVVRANPETMQRLGFSDSDTTSPASRRVTVAPEDLESEMARTREVTTAHHAYYLEGTDEEFLITDRILVRFRHDPTAEELDAFRARYALVERERYSSRDFLFQLTIYTGMNPVKLVVKLVEDERDLVELAEHDLNHRMSTYSLTLPTDPLYNAQWHLHRHPGSNSQIDPRSCACCEDAWRLLDNFGDNQVVIGFTDDGCKLDHSDLSASGKFTNWGYFVGTRLVRQADPDANPALMYQPGANHGTSCGGVMAGGVDGLLTVGAAPGVRLLPIRWESQGAGLFISDSKFRTVLDFVADKVDVLSNSWGAPRQNLWSTFVQDRLRELGRSGGRRGKGIVFLWAAGNDNSPIHHTADVDVPYTSGWRRDSNGNVTWIGVSRSRTFTNNLVGIDGVLHVAAICSTARRSHYSNYGTGVGICAPSSNTHKYNRMTVPGLGITTATGEIAGVTDQFGGTSSATPLVAGIAALVISANPDLSALQVIEILKRTASKDLDTTGYARTPAWPAIDPDSSWDVSPVAPFDTGVFRDTGSPDGTWSPWFGHGRVDAREAVERAMSLRRKSSSVIAPSSTPNRTIPDNRTGGITDTIIVLDSALLRTIEVTVAIRHPWSGDLRVRLRTPSGKFVVLHNRTGASARDIRRTYKSADLSDLANLAGESVKGQWTLQAEDLAAADEGVLERWEMKLSVVPAPLLFSESPGASIPDGGPAGLTRTLVVPAGTMARDLTVSVQAAHPSVADLRITVTPPGGGSVLLAEAGTLPGDAVRMTWSSANTPGLAALRNRDAGGVWTLKVVDTVAQNAGKLESWNLSVTV